MTESFQFDAGQLLDPRDLEAVQEARDADEQEAVFCTITAYRRPDTLRPGDVVAPLTLHRLSRAEPQTLKAIAGQPMVLFFGSFT